MTHIRRNAPLYGLLALILTLYLANAWAGRENARRDQGIVWLDVTSEASMQTYVVRAKVHGDRLHHFNLEATRYTFTDCRLLAPGNDAPCTDRDGGRWTVTR